MSVKNAHFLSRIAHLRQIAARLKLLSLEPLLGLLPALDLRGIDWVSLGANQETRFVGMRQVMLVAHSNDRQVATLVSEWRRFRTCPRNELHPTRL